MNTNTQPTAGRLIVGWALMVCLIGCLYLVIDALRTGGAPWYFIGRDGQRKYIMEEVFYMDDRAYAMAIYHDYVKFAEEQPFVLVDDQLNPQYV